MKKIKQLVIDDKTSELSYITLDEVINVSLSTMSIAQTLPIVVALSRRTFTNDFIVLKVGYSRQTVSYIHHGKHSFKQAERYIDVMLPLLISIGYKKSDIIIKLK